MAYLVGALLAFAVGGLGTVVGLDLPALQRPQAGSVFARDQLPPAPLPFGAARAGLDSGRVGQRAAGLGGANSKVRVAISFPESMAPQADGIRNQVNDLVRTK